MLLVFVLVSENDFGKRCATAWIVHNVLHKTLDVSKHNELRTNVKRWRWKRAVLHPKSATYPFLSAKSMVLKRAGETLFEVWALKIVLLPRRCTKKEQRVRLVNTRF